MHSSQHQTPKRTTTFSTTPVETGDIGRAHGLTIVGPVFLTVLAIVLWGASLRYVDVSRMTDLGLISVLPPMVFMAFIIMTLSFCLILHQRQPSDTVLLFHVIVLIFMLYGITTLVEDGPRISVTWRHVGVTEYVTRNGSINSKIDAHFNWPGFFILSAFFTEIAGFKSALSLAGWAPFYFNLLYLGPLVMILSSATNDKRLIWLGIWFFYLTNWVGQDYFAPQAFSYFLYLVILAILLKWFKSSTTSADASIKDWRGSALLATWIDRIEKLFPRDNSLSTPSEPGQRAGLTAIVVALFIVITPSHQLTPFAILGSVAMLVILNRCILRGLPILMAVVLATWISFMATSYMAGHIGNILEPLGKVTENVDANLIERLEGSREHLFIVRSRLVLSAFLWGLALLGGIQRLRRGHWDLALAISAVAPFFLLALQTYGGEALLRIYFFTLPFMAFFAAALFYTTRTTGSSWRATALIGLVSLVLLSGFHFTRYGNERIDYFTSQEVAAIHYLYDVAEPGSLFLAAWPHLPWKFQDYEVHRYMIARSYAKDGEVDEIVRIMQNENYSGSYLILSRSQKASAEILEGFPSESWERFEQALLESDKFRMIFANHDAKIFVLADEISNAAR